MRSTRAVAAAAVSTALVLSACGGGGGGGSTGGGTGGSSGGGPDGGGPEQLVLGAIVAPTTYEAAEMNWGNLAPFAQAVYDTLLRVAPNGVDVEPGLATDWSYDEAQTVLTLQLQDGVTFSDGTPFTAEVAVENLLRFRDGTSPQSIKFRDVADVRAPEEGVVEIELTRPNPAFAVYLTQAGGLMESPEAFDAPDVQTNPVGSGPYVLDTSSTVVGTSYAYTANPDYWDEGTQHYESLQINVYTDATSMLNAIRGGQLDAAVLQDNSILPEVESAGYEPAAAFLNLAGLLLLDRGGQLNPAMGDVRVRQAINYAIDADAFLETVGLGYGEVGDQVWRPEVPGYDEALDDHYAYDPDQARALLAEAGYADGVELVMPTTAGFGTALPPLLQQQLADVGIDVSYEDVGTNIVPEVLAGNYAATYFTLQQDPNPYQLIDFMLAPDATWNVFDYEDPEATALIEQVREAGGGDEAEEPLRQLNQLVVEQAWFAKWYTVQSTFITDADTDVEVSEGNVYPYLYDITPADGGS